MKKIQNQPFAVGFIIPTSIPAGRSGRPHIVAFFILCIDPTLLVTHIMPCSSDWPCVVALYPFPVQLECPPHSVPKTLLHINSPRLGDAILSLENHWDYISGDNNESLFVAAFITILLSFFVVCYPLCLVQHFI